METRILIASSGHRRLEILYDPHKPVEKCNHGCLFHGFLYHVLLFSFSCPMVLCKAGK